MTQFGAYFQKCNEKHNIYINVSRRHEFFENYMYTLLNTGMAKLLYEFKKSKKVAFIVTKENYNQFDIKNKILQENTC